MPLLKLAQGWSLKWRSANAALLRLFLRLVPSESHRLFALTLIAGGSCGLAAVFFHLSIIGTENRLIDRAMSASGRSWIWWTILTPTADHPQTEPEFMMIASVFPFNHQHTPEFATPDNQRVFEQAPLF